MWPSTADARVDIVVERLVIEEHLGQQTEVLAVDLAHSEGDEDARPRTLFLRPSISKTEIAPSR